MSIIRTTLVVGVTGAILVGAAGCAAVEEPASSSAQSHAAKAGHHKKHKAKPKPSLTRGQENAVESAKSYVDMEGFSKKGLIRQLKFEHFSTAEANFGASHAGANWNKEAVESAKSYLDMESFSRDGLAHQLAFEKFTPAQVAQAVAKVY